MVLQQSVDKAARDNKKAAAPQRLPAQATPTPLAAPVPVTAKTANAPAAQPGPPLAKPAAPTPKADDSKVAPAMQIIADESGLAIEDLTDETHFADAGVDSLLSMVIGSRFREELGLDLDTDFSIFIDLPTVKHLKEFLGGSSEEPAAPAAEGPISKLTNTARDSSPEGYDTTSEAEYSTPDETPDESGADTPAIKLSSYCKPATSVILQGIPKTAKKTLFLLPDGSGSASSYASIPRINTDVAVIGLNCPYSRDPENMNCNHVAYMESFCNEIRRRQPTGPYHLGGWSSGGAFAYVCAETFINQGEEVQSLIIIDAPVPQVMEKLPVEFYEYCNSIGLFPGGAAGPPDYLIPHFASTVDVMMDYQVGPLKTSRMPRVGILWACETVMEEENAPKMKGMHFMIQKRLDFGPDGWDTVCPGAEFLIEKVEGANHFSLMVSLMRDRPPSPPSPLDFSIKPTPLFSPSER